MNLACSITKKCVIDQEYKLGGTSSLLCVFKFSYCFWLNHQFPFPNHLSKSLAPPSPNHLPHPLQITCPTLSKSSLPHSLQIPPPTSPDHLPHPIHLSPSIQVPSPTSSNIFHPIQISSPTLTKSPLPTLSKYPPTSNTHPFQINPQP